MNSLIIEPEFESRTSFDFDSAILIETLTPTNEEQEIVIGGRTSISHSIISQESIYYKWKNLLPESTEIVVRYNNIILVIQFKIICHYKVSAVRKRLR